MLGTGPKATGTLEFGDLVEVTQEATEHSFWVRDPGKVIFNEWGPSAEFDFLGPHFQRVNAGAGWQVAIMHESEIVYRIASWRNYADADVHMLGKRILVQHPVRRDVTASGIQVVSTYYRSPNPTGMVIAIGDQVDGDDVKIGDWVMIKPVNGTLVTVNDREHTIIDACDVVMNFGSDGPPKVEIEGTAR